MKKFVKSLSALTNLTGNSIKLDREKSRQRVLKSNHTEFIKEYEETIKRLEDDITMISTVNDEHHKYIEYIQTNMDDVRSYGSTLLGLEESSVLQHKSSLLEWYSNKNDQLRVLLNDYHQQINIEETKITKLSKIHKHLSENEFKDFSESYTDAYTMAITTINESRDVLIGRIMEEITHINDKIECYKETIVGLDAAYNTNYKHITTLRKAIDDSLRKTDTLKNGDIFDIFTPSLQNDDVNPCSDASICEYITEFVKQINECAELRQHIIAEIHARIEQENIDFETHSSKYDKNNSDIQTKLTSIRNKIKKNKAHL
jgi:hypothetical protein